MTAVVGEAISGFRRGPSQVPARDAGVSFPPIVDARIERFIAGQPEGLAALVARHGSPLHIVWPHTMGDNVGALRAMFRQHGIEHEIFYGAKVNKSRALVRAAVDAGAGVDVSSLAEFEDALRAGADPSRLCATGPAKTAVFHEALVDAGALIAVDSSEELEDLERAIGNGRRGRVLLRLRPDTETASRFGMGREAMTRGLTRLAGRRSAFAFEGFHVHLASYEVADRVAAMPVIADLVDTAAEMGLAARTIDIGGGQPVRYVAPDRYAAALAAQGPGDYRDARVPASFYRYGGELGATEWLEAFLEAPCRGGTIAGYLKGAGLRLAIEPGRSLVDQAAISLFRVTRVKALGDGTAVIFVEGSSFSACETWFQSEFLVDPVLVRTGRSAGGGGPLRACIAGHSCLEQDVVTNRLLAFPAAPVAGDLLIYANTAGYQMDLLENEFHRHPMPRRLVASTVADGGLVFFEDK